MKMVEFNSRRYELRVARTCAHLWTTGVDPDYTHFVFPFSRMEEKELARRIVECLNAFSGQPSICVAPKFFEGAMAKAAINNEEVTK